MTQLAETLSWRLLTKFWQRFPDRYALIETHPGGGMYDCLSLAECKDGFHSILDVNRGGSLHLHKGQNHHIPCRLRSSPFSIVSEAIRKGLASQRLLT